MSPTTVAILLYKKILSWEELQALFPDMDKEIKKRINDEYDLLIKILT